VRYRRSITQPLAGSKSENEIFVVFLIIGLRRHNCACRKSYQNGSIKSHVVCRGNLRFMRSVSVIQFVIVITWLLVTEAKGSVKKVKKVLFKLSFFNYKTICAVFLLQSVQAEQTAPFVECSCSRGSASRELQ